MIDDAVIQTLVQDIAPVSGVSIVEIGPGKGALTRRLYPLSNNYVAIEADPRIVKYLEEKPMYSSINLITADAAKVDISHLLKLLNSDEMPVLAGNLPYNQAGPIMRRFLPELKHFTRAYFMVQYEVAKRMAAAPGNRTYGALSVLTQNWADVAIIRKIPPDAFRPKPKVMSATVELKSREPVVDAAGFLPFVHQAFANKRKQLVNTLSKPYGKEVVLKILKKFDLAATIRAEEISVEQFGALYHALK